MSNPIDLYRFGSHAFKEHDAKEVVSALTAHRDAWRSYAYGKGKRPQDFMWGSYSLREKTKVELLEEENASLKQRLQAIEGTGNAN